MRKLVGVYNHLLVYKATLGQGSCIELSWHKLARIPAHDLAPTTMPLLETIAAVSDCAGAGGAATASVAVIRAAQSNSCDCSNKCDCED